MNSLYSKELWITYKLHWKCQYSLLFHRGRKCLTGSFLLPVHSCRTPSWTSCREGANWRNNQHNTFSCSLRGPLRRAAWGQCCFLGKWSSSWPIWSPCLRSKLPFRTCSRSLALREELFWGPDSKYQRSWWVCCRAKVAAYCRYPFYSVSSPDLCWFHKFIGLTVCMRCGWRHVCFRHIQVAACIFLTLYRGEQCWWLIWGNWNRVRSCRC